jgi:RNA polymerase sigma factor (sigma-70 family)
VLKRQCAGALARSQQEVEDLVQDTFRRAFERAETFRSDEHVDSDQLRRRCRAWLGRIAKNLLADALNRIREASTLDALLERPSEPERQPEEPSALLAHVEEVIQSLSEREQDVIRVFCLYYRPGEVNQRLPNAVSAELASRWRTTPDHIRVIRSRALQRIKAHVMDNWTREKEVSA